MFGSAVVYGGLIVAIAGLALVVKPIRWLRVTTRRRGAGVAAAGVLLAGIGLFLPVSESRVTRVESRLDEFAPAWQFRERHTMAVDAPPGRVFDAIEHTRPDEIFLFRTLIWIRGQPIPQDILDAGARGESLIDIALRTTFVRLARDVPGELVVGTVVGWPPGPRPALTPQIFQQNLPDGFALAAMNFVVTPDGPSRSIVSTETRVYANSPARSRRFARYWRVIYPGSALIRRMWLRAIARRATGAG